MTFEKYLTMWLEDYAVSNLKPTVYDNNKYIVDKRIIPELGK